MASCLRNAGCRALSHPTVRVSPLTIRCLTETSPRPYSKRRMLSEAPLLPLSRTLQRRELAKTGSDPTRRGACRKAPRPRLFLLISHDPHSPFESSSAPPPEPVNHAAPSPALPDEPIASRVSATDSTRASGGAISLNPGIPVVSRPGVVFLGSALHHFRGAVGAASSRGVFSPFRRASLSCGADSRRSGVGTAPWTQIVPLGSGAGHAHAASVGSAPASSRSSSASVNTRAGAPAVGRQDEVSAL